MENHFKSSEFQAPNLNVPDYFTKIIVNDEWRAGGQFKPKFVR